MHIGEEPVIIRNVVLKFITAIAIISKIFQVAVN